MSQQFERYDPAAWQDEDGLLLPPRALLAKASTEQRKTDWKIKAVVFGASVLVSLSSAVPRASGADAMPRIMAKSPRPVRASPDADVVTPTYWSEVAAYLRALPSLPDEHEMVDPELPDADLDA